MERLLEYKMYKYISQELKDRQMDAAMLLFKGRTLPSEIEEYKEEIRAADLLAGLTLSKLHAVFESVIKRQNDKIDPIRSRFGRIEREEVNLSDKILQIQHFGMMHRHFSFSPSSFISRGRSISDLILNRVAAITRNSLIISSFFLSICRIYSMYCSVICTIGISYIFILFLSIKCRSKSSGPSNASSFTGIPILNPFCAPYFNPLTIY